MFTIEDVEVIYFDKDALREPNYKLKRFNKDGKRYYYKRDDFNRIYYYPSVTTLLGDVVPENEYLEKWKEEQGPVMAKYIMEWKAEYGTIMHILIAYFLVNKKINLNSLTSIFDISKYKHWNDDWVYELQSDLAAFAKFANDVELKPLAIEVMLCSEKYKIAGAIDLVAEITYNKKRIIVLIDFKSSRKNYSSISHELQLGYYKAMWEENFPNYKIDKIYNWKPKDFRTATPTYTLTDQSEKCDVTTLEAYHTIYYSKNIVKPADVKVISGDLILGKVTDNVAIMQMDDVINSLETKVYVDESGEVYEESWDFETVDSAPTKSNLPVNNYEDF